MHAAPGTLAMSRLGPGGGTHAYIWLRSWRKPETPTAPVRPECAFDPKGDSRQPCVRSELEARPGSLGGHLFLYKRIATSSTPSTPYSQKNPNDRKTGVIWRQGSLRGCPPLPSMRRLGEA